MGRIVWLASYPKSGNTWIRAFLHNLLGDSESATDINAMTDLTPSDGALGWYQDIDLRPPAQWSTSDIDAMRPRVQETIARSRPGIVFCKTHAVLATIRGVATVNPHVAAGAIYVIRNPLDVAVSFADFNGVPLDTAIDWMATDNFEIPTTDKSIKTPLGSWSQHVESWTAKAQGKVHVMRYEDMVASPARAFAGLAGYLNLNPSRERMRLAIKHASFKSLSAQEARKGFVERPKSQARFFRKGTAGQWRTALSAEQVARIVERHRAQMERFDYVPTVGEMARAQGPQG